MKNSESYLIKMKILKDKWVKKGRWRHIESQLKFDENKCKHVLGVEWGTKNDEFPFRFSDLNGLARSLRTTKRNVLKVSASFHDPLGMISLVTNRVKTIFHYS